MVTRSIHIGDKEYRYRIGACNVVILPPSGKRHNTWVSSVTKENPDDIERAQWKGYWKGVRPSQVRDYILEKGL